LFPTKLCRFRQTFLVSDKSLLSPTNLCHFLDNLNKNVKSTFYLRRRVRQKTTKTDKHKPCRFRQGFVASNKALLFPTMFPTRLCRFWQGFVISDKALLFPTRLCRFWQGFVVSDMALLLPTSALSENRELRNWIIHVTACRTCVPATHCDTTKRLVYTHTQWGNLPCTISRRSYEEHSFRPELPV
jgi:hypothetical protein